MKLVRIGLALSALATMACAHGGLRPAVVPTPATEALLVLPGFGYGGDGERTFRSLAPRLAEEGIDLYLPAYVDRDGLEESRERLRQFVQEARLDRYDRVHVFAFLAGAWTFNPLADAGLLPNLSTVIFDRSPYQERAPRVAQDKLPFPARLKYGEVIFDLARTPYVPLTTPAVRVGILVETVPTTFIRRFAASAARHGPYQFECDAFGQRYDDCGYVAMSHDELYERFAEVWPDVRAFIRTGRFSQAVVRAGSPVVR
jgi:hypothetical protein